MTPTATAIDDGEDSECDIDDCKNFEPEVELYNGQYFKSTAHAITNNNKTSVLGKRTHREAMDEKSFNKAAKSTKR